MPRPARALPCPEKDALPPRAELCICEPMQVSNEEVFALHASFCQMLANAKRLIILDMLGRREMSVGELAQSLRVRDTVVSQHLRLLRHQHLVLTRRDGQTIYYRLAYPRMIEACHIIRAILMENLKRHGRLSSGLRPEHLIPDEPRAATSPSVRKKPAASQRAAKQRRKKA